MKVHRGPDVVATPAGQEHFTGLVWLSPIYEADAHGAWNSAHVKFAPLSRTHWHSHPDGQALVVLEGRGRIQSEGGPRVAIAAGDSLFVPPGESHWHGADPDAFMTHISVTGEGGTVWDGPPVSDAEYGGAPAE